MLLDANLLVYAHVKESERYEQASAWLEEAFNGAAKVGLPWPTLLAFVRLMGNARVVSSPVPLSRSWSRIKEWLALPTTWIPLPTSSHVEVLGELLGAESRADLVNDAHLAALALEHGLTVFSTDRDFSRFPGVRWRDPLTDENKVRSGR